MFHAETAAGWRKYDRNPVLGRELGTCFDIVVLREEDIFRMYFSWRPQKSIALLESADGIHWQEPHILLTPNPDSGWEDNINRPSVIRRDDGYHMWYTGQARGHSWIGYATSPDGFKWAKLANNPIFYGM